MSCPRKLFLDERKSSETSACRPTSVRCLKENIYSLAFHVRHHFLFSLRTWERGKTACGRLRRQTSARTKTSARLKITFVDITYPGQRLEPPSLSPHFLLVIVMVVHYCAKKCKLPYVLRLLPLPTYFLRNNEQFWLVYLSTNFAQHSFLLFSRNSHGLSLLVLLTLHWEVFLWVLRFSPLLKNQYLIWLALTC